jgi:hypothetical protein
MKLQFCFFILFVFFTNLSSVNAQSKNTTGVYYDYKVRCIGKELDGSLTLEAFGKGRNYFDASEQAKKDAVYAVIFLGIREGNGGCNSDPIILNSSVQAANEDYFANFFRDKGPYTEFTSLKDERISNKIDRNSMKTRTFQQRMLVVRVDRLGIKNKLIKDNIIKF